MNAYEAGRELLCGGYSSYTPTGKGYFVKEDRWFKDPRKGDIVYFYTTNLGRVSHVGLVKSANYFGDRWTIKTIEGNTAAGTIFSRDGGEVAEKTYSFFTWEVGGIHRINGFGRPRYGEEGLCTAEQMIAVAEAEIGYVEKESAEGLDEKTANPGDENWTKYGLWYGLVPAQWCQEFISWCAYTACKIAREGKPTEWIKQESGHWAYRKADGSFARSEWQYINGRWYVFDAASHMITGWFKQNGDEWYYLAEDGGMLSSQWVQDNGKDYYLTASGLMARNAYVRSKKPVGPGAYMYYWVNEEGVWEPNWDTETPILEVYELAE